MKKYSLWAKCRNVNCDFFQKVKISLKYKWELFHKNWTFNMEGGSVLNGLCPREGLWRLRDAELLWLYVVT